MLIAPEYSHIPAEYRHGIDEARKARILSSDTHGLAVGASFLGADGNRRYNASNTMCAGTHHHEKRAAMGKYRKDYIPHAEVTLIAGLARMGIGSDGGTMSMTLSPCANCVNSLVHAGIKRVVVFGDPYLKDNETWGSIVLGRVLLHENDVEYLDFSLSQHDYSLCALFLNDRFRMTNQKTNQDTVKSTRGVYQQIPKKLRPLFSVCPGNLEYKLNDKGRWYMRQHEETMRIFGNVYPERNERPNGQVTGYLCP